MDASLVQAPPVEPRPVEDVCMECGARMREHQRVREHGAYYVWLLCTGPNCTGQMLRKIPAIR